MKTITLLLADDHAIVRQGLRRLLETDGNMQVVGEAADGQQAVLETKRLQPDVVLLDLAMPLLNGVQAARQIAHEVPTAKVLILSSYSDGQHLQQAVEAGVAGYVMKETAGDDLLEAIRAAGRGTTFFSPPVLKNLLKQSKKRAAAPPASNGCAALSWRQAEVLQLIAEGYGTKQIADVLSISVKTAERHRQTLMDKLNIHEIATLTRYAVSNGVVESNRIPGWQANSRYAPRKRETILSRRMECFGSPI
jgi:DNA-binding NarL/FixJ family response regulator